MQIKKTMSDFFNTGFEILEHFSFILTFLGFFPLVSFLSVNTEFTIIGILDYAFMVIIALKIIYACFRFFYRKDLQKTLTQLGIGLLFLILYIWARYLDFTPSDSLQPVFHKFSLILRIMIYSIYLFINKEKIKIYLRGMKLNPAQSFSLGFIVLIMLGTWLLSLPYSTTKPLSFLDTVFTSTSAVCVTGLITVDTATHFTMFGKTVILFLIQFGALGIMSFTTFLLILSGSKINFYERSASMEMFNQDNFHTLRRLITVMLVSTVIIEALGALFIYWNIPANANINNKVFFSVFHSISAFCNAGFSTLSDSLSSFYGHFNLNIIISALIIFGGLGFPVIQNLKEHFTHKRRLTLHTRIVLISTLVLTVLGTLMFFLEESRHVLIEMDTNEKWISSFFQSVTTRTAGFNTVNMGQLQDTTLLWFILFMFIGASPGSTGGGLKTTTFFLLLTLIFFAVKGRKDHSIFRQKIRTEIFIKVGALFFIRVMVIFIATMMILYHETKPFIPVLFEVVSAFSTVGLSTGITATLSQYSKVIIIFLMFIGRIGPINVLASLSKTRKNSGPAIEYSEGYVIIE